MKRKLLYSSALIVSAIVNTGTLYADTTTYTSDADFASGIINGVNYDAPNSNQLQINSTGTTFPYLWVANYGDATFSKVNTDGPGCEEARYLTWYGDALNNTNSTGPAPSRTAVNVDGDVYLANRHFDGGTPDLIKFAVDGGIDRNGNGVIDTSRDLNGNCIIEPSEMLSVVDDGDGVLDIDDFLDERVIWVRQFGTPGSLGRSVCLDTNGNIWAGTFNTRSYYKFDPNGNLLAGPISTGSARNYGCAVDASGILWGATLSSLLVKLDTNTNTFLGTFSGSSNYGIALGASKVYLGSTLRSFDPTTSSFGPVIAGGGTGVAVDGDGAVWFGTPTLRKFEINPGTGFLNTSPVCSVSTQGVRGPIIDKDGNVWTINLSHDTVSQYNSSCGFVSSVTVGDAPYTYSDATGFGQRSFTDPTGIWTVTKDSGDNDTEWDLINWNNEPEGNIPSGASIEIKARSANVEGNLALETFIPISNNTPGIGLTGRFIEIQATLRPTTGGVSPILSDVSVSTLETFSCDANNDNQVDRLDIRLIGAHRNVPVPPGDPLLDIDGDGFINVNDARKCSLLCDFARCATTGP
ncbi:hypothetical protein [Vibrio sp. HN007]|uniref:hypothetical protein n=1 Tax=Vibrio iocasae TaxID=3098914 RepID=UPI0035D4D855